MSHRTHGAPACPRASAPGTPEAGGTPSPAEFAHVSIAIRPSGICARRNSRPLNSLLFLMTCGLLHGLTARSPQPRLAQRHPVPFPPLPAMTLPAMTSPAMPTALRPHSPDDARLLRASLIAVWLITIAAVRLSSGFDTAGVLALAMSISNLFVPIAEYRLRTVQVTDVRGEHTARQYLGMRVLSSAAAVVAGGRCDIDDPNWTSQRRERLISI